LEAFVDWEKTYRRIEKLRGRALRSISGKADIRFISISPDHYVVQTPRGLKKRRTAELKKAVKAMSLNKPVHVESKVLKGGNSSRSHPETILAALPDVEWLRIKRRKHIVWRDKDSHKLGSLKESDSP
jgi:hypothetical protein